MSKYYESRGKLFKRAYIVRKRVAKTRWGYQKGEVFRMLPLGKLTLGLEHDSNRPVLW